MQSCNTPEHILHHFLIIVLGIQVENFIFFHKLNHKFLILQVNQGQNKCILFWIRLLSFLDELIINSSFSFLNEVLYYRHSAGFDNIVEILFI